MGQSSKNKRRGGFRWSGGLAPPGSPDWTWTSLASEQLTVERIVQLPSGVTAVQIRYGRTSLTEYEYTFLLSTNPQTVGGSPSGATWRAQLAFYGGGVRLSEGSDTKKEASL